MFTDQEFLAGPIGARTRRSQNGSPSVWLTLRLEEGTDGCLNISTEYGRGIEPETRRRSASAGGNTIDESVAPSEPSVSTTTLTSRWYPAAWIRSSTTLTQKWRHCLNTCFGTRPGKPFPSKRERFRYILLFGFRAVHECELTLDKVGILPDLGTR